MSYEHTTPTQYSKQSRCHCNQSQQPNNKLYLQFITIAAAKEALLFHIQQFLDPKSSHCGVLYRFQIGLYLRLRAKTNKSFMGHFIPMIYKKNRFIIQITVNLSLARNFKCLSMIIRFSGWLLGTLKCMNLALISV